MLVARKAETDSIWNKSIIWRSVWIFKVIFICFNSQLANWAELIFSQLWWPITNDMDQCCSDFEITWSVPCDGIDWLSEKWFVEICIVWRLGMSIVLRNSLVAFIFKYFSIWGLTCLKIDTAYKQCYKHMLFPVYRLGMERVRNFDTGSGMAHEEKTDTGSAPGRVSIVG